MPLQLSTRPITPVGYVVALDGSLDSNTSAQLETELQRLLATRPMVLLLNLAKLDYISSTGIRVVQKTKRAMEAANGEFKLASPQPQVAKVFEFVQLSPLNDLFASIEELDAYLDRAQKTPPPPAGG